MPLKTLRLQIIKPYNELDEEEPLTWYDMGLVLRDLRYMASKSANYVIQRLYAWEYFRKQEKERLGEYPIAKEHKDKTYHYPVLCRMFPEMAGQMVNQIEQFASKVWRSRKNEVLKLHQSVPSFKLDFPICVHNKSYSIASVDNNYIISANLLSKHQKRSRFRFIIKAGENSKRVILDRIISGLYQKGALQIVSDRKKKWYCLIPYKFTASNDKEINPEKIMGVDLGISNAAYWAFNDSLKRGRIDGQEIEVFRKRVQERRKSIQRQGKYCGDGRIGHGIKRRLKPIVVLQEKESNFRATTNHRYAKRIVDIALQSKCGTIQIENLTGINENSTFLKNWPYYDLQQKIIEKASVYGINVVNINPEYTSQRCSRCGYIDKGNRPDQPTFECKSCGFGTLYHCFDCDHDQKEGGICQICGSDNTKKLTVHADYNAAKNIAIPGIEKIIHDTLVSQGDAVKPVQKTKKRK